MKRMLLITLITMTLGYAAVCLMISLRQRHMLYFPSSMDLAEQLAYAPGAGLEPWNDSAGKRIGWKRVGRGGSGTAQRWLILHGNAGLAVQRAYWADALERVLPGRALSVYILEYPGYGRREGSPTQAVLTAAALAAFDAIPPEGNRIFLLGESLGCAVAAQVAHARPDRTGGVVLVSPFNRLADVAGHHYPWLPVRWLVRDTWKSDEALRGFAGPVAILAAERDSVVPAIFAQRLHAGYEGRKWLQVIPGEDHNMFVFDQTWFREAVGFATAE
jgi:pimeloyl-ACP methyl ester carboxylesterase